jgi:mannosyltransferase
LDEQRLAARQPPTSAAPHPVSAADSGGIGWWRPVGGVAARLFGAVWLWPALATFILGMYKLDSPALWRDEIATWTIATRSVPGLLATMRHTDAAQVAYYLFMHYWLAILGSSAIAMRLPSVFAMAGAAACVALLGRRLSGRRAGLVSGLVFAVLPSVSRYAQEARSYAPMVLAATLAAVLLLRALEAPGWGRWTVYGLCVAATGYLNLVALAMLAGHAVVVGLDARARAARATDGQVTAGQVGTRRPWGDRRLLEDRRIAGFAVAAAGGAAATLPVILLGLGQARNQIGWIPRPGVGFVAAFGANLFYSPVIATAVVLLALLAWAPAELRRGTAMATAMAVAPVAVVWLISQSGVSYFDPRYLLFTLAAWAILAGSAVAAHGIRMTAALLIVLALLSAGDQRAIRLPAAHQWAAYPARTGLSTNYTNAAWLIASNARAGDGIAYEGWPVRWRMIDSGVQYYLAQDLGDYLPGGRSASYRMPRRIFVARTAVQDSTLYPQVCARPADCIGDEARVWIVGFGRAKNPFRLLPAAEADVLRARYKLHAIAYLDGLTVALMVR